MASYRPGACPYSSADLVKKTFKLSQAVYSSSLLAVFD